jgi:ATP-binding cassette, subfamily A (ABC1), member 3
MSLPAYWISNMIADVFKVFVPVILILITTASFGYDFKGIWVLFLLFPTAIVPFTYATSFLFSNDTRAQISTLFLHFAVTGVLAPLIFIFQANPTTFIIGDQLRWWCCIVPSYPLVNGILWAAAGERIIPAVREAYPKSHQIAANYWGI